MATVIDPPGDRRFEEHVAYRLSAIIESSDDAIVSKSLDGIVRTWNPAAARIFGYTAEEMVGQSIRRIIPDDRQQEEDEVLRRIRLGERVEHFETVRQRKDGSFVPISLTISPVTNDQGEIVGASKIARDITERVAAEETMRASLALKDQFLNLVSHELRTPIATVVGNAQMLIRRADRLQEGQRAQALTDISTEAGRLQRIIEDLLVLTRLNVRERMAGAPVDLVELAHDVIAAARRGTPREYVLDVAEELPPALGERTLIELTLGNLLGNADKYSPPGAPVEVILRHGDAGTIEAQVLDRGIGIPPEDVERVFEPFYRATSARTYAPGMGLGLAVSQRSIEVQGGWIGVEPRPGGGSVFRFGLPVAAPAAGPVAGPASGEA